MCNAAPQVSSKEDVEAETRLNSLEEWLKLKEVQLVDTLEIRRMPRDEQDDQRHGQQPRCSYGIFATREVKPHDVLATIPKSAILSRKAFIFSADDTSYQDLCVIIENESPQHAGVRILAVVLSCEILLRQSSDWYGYIRSLPQTAAEVDLPTYWEDQEALDWLATTDIQNCLESTKCTQRAMKQFYDNIVRPFLASKFSQESSEHREESFRLALSLVLSRAFYVDNYHNLSMVPLADVFNHHYEPHACLQSDDIVCSECGSVEECEHDEKAQLDDMPLQPKGRRDGQARKGSATRTIQQTEGNSQASMVEMIATSYAEAGDEIFNTYGKQDNAYLIANYGFSLEANIDDKVRWYTVKEFVQDSKIGDKVSVSGSAIEQVWRQDLQNYQSAVLASDFILSDLEVESAHRLPAHELIFIDADGALSRYAWCLLSVAAKFQDSGQGGRVSASGDDNAIQDIAISGAISALRARLVSHKCWEKSLPETFDLQEQSESEQVKLAIGRVIDERMLLTACLANWQSST